MPAETYDEYDATNAGSDQIAMIVHQRTLPLPESGMGPEAGATDIPFALVPLDIPE